MIFQRQYFPIICTIIIGISASLYMFQVVTNWERMDQRVEFESRSMGYANALENEFNLNVEALLSLKDYFDYSEFINRQEFNGFVNSLLFRHPSIQAFGWNPLVQDSERADYEFLAQNEGFENFQFTERSEENKLVRAGQRQEYVVVYYIAPLESNKPAFGYDIASDPTRLKAINQGFKTGELTVTEKITLVQETGKQAGVLLLLPIYQQSQPPETLEERLRYRKGFLVEVLRIGDVVMKTLQNYSDAGIDLYLYDMSVAKEEDGILYPQTRNMVQETGSPLKKEAHQGGFYFSKNFDFGGRQWKMVFQPSSSYTYSHNILHAWIILCVLLFFTFSLAFYLLKKLKYTSEIEQRVQEQTHTNQQLKKEITEREQAETKLQESQKRFKDLTEMLPEAVFETDIDINVTYANRQAFTLFGYTRQDFENGLNGISLIVPEEREKARENIAKRMLGEEFGSTEYYAMKKDGSIFPILLHASPIIKQGTPQGLRGIIMDISELKKTEKLLQKHHDELEQRIEERTLQIMEINNQLLHSEKLSALGRLTASIAHEFNNPLYGIQSVLEGIVTNFPLDEEYQKLTDLALSECGRVKELILSLQNFSRPSPGIKESTDINALLDDMLFMVRKEYTKANITVKKQYAADLPNIQIIPDQIKQVVLNLLTNAREAINDKIGTVTVITENRINGIAVRISDTGYGITSDILPHIFEPFYTTKETIMGSGIGLSVSYGIIRAHGGDIKVDSVPGAGTTFSITLPFSLEDR